MRLRRRRPPRSVNEYATQARGWTPDDERRLVREWVARLAPSGIDAGTGAALDTYIEQRRRWWRAALESYREASMERFDKDEADAAKRLELRRQRLEPELRRKEHAEAALNAARQRLSGRDEEDGDWQRSAKAGPGYEGYANPALGRGRGGSVLYVILLVLAGAADLVAFYQVMGLVLRGQTIWALWPATIGFTAVALGLAHLGGRFARGRKAGEKGVAAWMVWVCLLAWAVLGLGAFLLRLLIAEPRNESTIRLGGDLFNAEGSDVSSEELWSRAVVLLILYIATGAMAYVGAYLLHNPLHADYQKAEREYRRTARRVARRKADLTQAETVHRQWLEARERERRRWELELEQIEALCEELKDVARLEMASRIQDPSSTTGLAPYNGRDRHESTSKEHE